jgi:hypothetical protein
VVLAADEQGYPKRPYLAVRFDDQAAAKPAPAVREELKRAVDAGYAVGKASDYSLWYRYIDKAYAPWGAGDAMLRLYRKGEAVTYFVGHLEQLVRVLEKALGASTAS